jgi:DNA-binding NarL/FixJ family response regulator
MSPIRVLIADDHRILREGVRALLSACPDLEVVGEAEGGLQAVELCGQLDPDVAVLDIAMPGLGGLEATLALRKQQPRTKILILTQYEDPEYVRRFLKAGVSGFVLKRTAGSALAEAIRAVHRGGLVLDPEVARDALDDGGGPRPRADDPYEALTDREKQVFKLVAEGQSNKEIAHALGITVKTAMTHRERMMQKLDLHNRTDVVRHALKLGVIRMQG